LNGHLIKTSVLEWRKNGFSFSPNQGCKGLILISDKKEIETFWRDKQPLKHFWPIEETDKGIKTEDNDEHPSKQLSPIEVTEFGIEMIDNDEHQ
jgi:hypothetical protein